jgi:hypothetical protein
MHCIFEDYTDLVKKKITYTHKVSRQRIQLSSYPYAYNSKPEDLNVFKFFISMSCIKGFHYDIYIHAYKVL